MSAIAAVSHLPGLREDRVVPFASYPVPPRDEVLARVSAVLDPVLAPLGFAPGQVGADDGHAQVVFCRGRTDDDDDGECVDLVVDLVASPDWRISDVRYWGFPSDRWHLLFDVAGDLERQLAGLSRALPGELR